MPSDTDTTLRHDWTRDQAEALFRMPFNDLVMEAQALHRRYFDANKVQMSRLLSVKTGGCPEDCAYCPQSAQHDTGVKAEKIMAVDDVLAGAEQARNAGATRRSAFTTAPPAWCACYPTSTTWTSCTTR